ncbi:class I SAM-dependent methyltransferase [Methylobacterium sp. HMF5984]|uniref:class I SAM-dependent methyltransferase n=1 Tax=unclassified Methylobacterium TaxID=2615210 RepID=UPI0011C782F8|nr:methyltransferase domain-containing protein [Methylobacterium sp. WL6]TXN61393.1 methyltransferase domain-containing protein [Methylobacterium sp. WL6]
MDTLSLVLDAFSPIAGRRIVDIGCGPGAMSAALAGHGARVTGIDPGEAAVAAARRRAPDCAFEICSAEALPFSDGTFGGAVILNALHHVPDPRAALHEAARVVAPGGRIVVVEPLAEGSFFSALKPVEDETAIRAAAQAAIAAAIAAGAFLCLSDRRFVRREAFADRDAFLERVAAVDPARRAAIRDNASTIADAFAAAAETDAGGRHVLSQPLRAHVLVAATTS